MKYLLIIILLIYSVFLFSDFFIANSQMKPIHSGDNIYIFNTSGIMSFSLDIPENILEYKKIENYGNKILIGKLKERINAGFASYIILNTQSGAYEIPFVISPIFLSIKLNKTHYLNEDTIKGEIIFKSLKKTTGNGIDSLKLHIIGDNFYDSLSILIFSIDSIYDYDYSAGFFNFNIPINLKDDEYYINCIYYTGNLCDTIHYAQGFYIGEFNKQNNNLLIIDTKNKEERDALRDYYYTIDFDMYSTFFRGIDNNIKDYDIIAIINTENGYFWENYNNLLQLMNNGKPVFMFCPDIGNIINQPENEIIKDTLEKILNAIFVKDTFADSLILPVEQRNDYKYSFIIDKNKNNLTNYIVRDNIFLFTYLPQMINIEKIKLIYENKINREKKELLKDFMVIALINNNEYNEYTLDIYDLSGKIKRIIFLGNLFYGENVLNINELIRKTSDIKPGLYFYKLKRSEKCLQNGKIIFLY